MPPRTLIVSDLHFGLPDALLACPAALDRLEPELAWADRRILAGDTFSLLSASWKDVIRAARPFARLAGQLTDEICVLAGNHDHHLATLVRDEERIAGAVGFPAPGPADNTAAQQLASLFAGADVRFEHPYTSAGPVTVIHGHVVDLSLPWTGWPARDRRIWRRHARRGPRQPVAHHEHERLIGPLFELGYHARQELVPGAAAAQNRLLMHLARAGGGKHGQPHLLAAAFARPWWERARPARRRHVRPRAALLNSLAQACHDLGVQPGVVVYGHSHQAHDAARAPMDDRWQFINSGSWTYDRFLLRHAAGSHWPGTVVRIHGDGHAQRRELLTDIDAAQLERWLSR